MANTNNVTLETATKKRGYYPGTRAPSQPGLYGLADKRFAKYENGKWFLPNFEPDRAMQATLGASTSSPKFRTQQAHYWCEIPEVIESIKLLNGYYFSDPIGEGELLSNCWFLNRNVEHLEFCRVLGGSGTPFVQYDLTVKQGDDESWIPFHGIVAKKAHATATEAGNFLINYWRALSLRDRLTEQRYKELIAF